MCHTKSWESRDIFFGDVIADTIIKYFRRNILPAAALFRSMHGPNAPHCAFLGRVFSPTLWSQGWPRVGAMLEFSIHEQTCSNAHEISKLTSSTAIHCITLFVKKMSYLNFYPLSTSPPVQDNFQWSYHQRSCFMHYCAPNMS